MNEPDASPGAGRPVLWHAMVVLAVSAAVYLPRLGAGGLTMTEGHRAIPGWGMVESGDWLLPRLFGQVYLRKPPGMSWAVGASSLVFGETEFAARLPSALAMMGMSLVAMVFAARWFGRGVRSAGLAAGLATALTPWFWSSGRSAEIEALNNFGTCAAVLLVLELMVNREGRRWWGSLVVAALLGEAILVAALAKGPAGFAPIGSAVAVGMAMVGVDRSEPRSVARVRAGLWLGAAVVPSVIVLAVLYAAIMGAAAQVQRETGQVPVVQGVSEFFWGAGALTVAGLAKVVAVGPAALLAALPGSLALLLAWGGRRPMPGEGGTPVAHAREQRIARALACTCLLSLLVLTVLGVGNPRYAMPSVCFVPVVVGYAWRRAMGQSGASWRPGELDARAKLTLMRGRVSASVLLIAAAVWIGVLEPRERGRSGREAGVSLGAALPDGAMVWADGVIEARPEVLWYAQQEAAGQGRKVAPVWIVQMAKVLSLPRHGYLLLRTDGAGSEEAAYREAGFLDHLTKVWEGKVHKYSCALYRKE